MSNKDTAILLFSRSASAEAEVKSLTWNKKSSEKVATVMINHTKTVVADTKLPFYVFSEKQQIGDSFGERLANAFEAVFNKGYQKVLVVGNDCLDLQTNDLLHAAALLEQHSTLLGPTKDGGVYVLGIHRKAFDKASLLKINWQTSLVYTELKALHKDASILVRYSDIDNAADLHHALKFITRDLQKKISALLCMELAITKPTSVQKITSRSLSFKSLRGPPALAS